jgi:hypothetical protein
MSAPIELTWKRNDTGRLNIIVTQANGSPYDITGASLFLTVKKSAGVPDASALISKKVTAHDDPTNGESHFSIDTTDNDISGRYVFDVQIKTAADDVWTLFDGVWKVVSDVTQRVA